MEFTTDLQAALAHTNLDPALANWLATQVKQVQQHSAEITRQRAELTHKDQELRNKDLKIQALTLELAQHKRIRFGFKSEHYSAEQGELFQETWNTDASAIEAEVEQLIPAIKHKRPRAGRQPLPSHLPRIEHRHEPATCTCGQCGSALTLIGEDVSEQLDVEPARFFVHRHIRPQYACRPCETVVAEPIPPAVIDGSMAAPGLLAWVITNKYLDHLPLYRIEQISARQGVPIARSTLAEWVGRVGVALQPLADRLVELLKQRTVLHADETPVQQLDPGAGKTKRAYLWAYRSNDLDAPTQHHEQPHEYAHAHGPPQQHEQQQQRPPHEQPQAPPRILVFDYQTSRSGSHAQTFLDGWQGHLMVDDYAGYKALFRAGITELGCMAHARRKFFELHAANQSPLAAEALRRIGELYEIEAQGKALDNDARHALRQREAAPKLAALYDWLRQTRLTVAEGGGMARAIDYSLKRWVALIRYAQSGHLPIDNNPVENVIRPIAIGKKNWLFTGSERAGRQAAAIQSLLGTAKLNGLEPYAWLKETLEKLPTWPNSRIDELLPLGRRDGASI